LALLGHVVSSCRSKTNVGSRISDAPFGANPLPGSSLNSALATGSSDGDGNGFVVGG